MNKISILTFWGVPNYGAFAQAYALNKVLSSMYPNIKIEHIAYLNKAHHDLYYKKEIPEFLRWWDIINPRYYKRLLYHLLDSERHYPNFENDWAKIPQIKIKTDKELEKTEWDTVITGSDCIWEYSIQDFGDDVHLIGNNMKFKKLIAYASSFGDMNPNDCFPEFVKIGLKKYYAISVRDWTSFEIVHNQGISKEINIPIVLDPTLLYDFKSDKSIPESKHNSYILVYGNNFSDKTINDVKNYANDKNLKIIGAGIAPSWCDIKINDISPLEWIGMFDKAEMVVTCTFHGLMFGINYNKKILFNQVEYVRNRSMWLLEQLGLSELYVGDVSVKKVQEYSWNYDSINQKLKELRQQSFRFLERNI